MQSIARHVETARHLKPAQLGWWLYRRTRGRSYRPALPAIAAPRAGISMGAPIAPSGLVSGEGTFRFLNVSRDFASGIDWQCAGASRLWRYNLHYFDYALDEARPPEWVREAMESWVRSNPPAPTVGWEPYPVSLRIVNWVKFALTRDEEPAPDAAWMRSLHQQIGWLERNLEYEIQANHLLKNAKALLFGGAFFRGPDAERWLETGDRLFGDQVREQMLADGGHYERSPMYHAIVLEDMLDVLNLLRSSPGLPLGASARELEAKARAGLRFIETLTYPDGEIALFNDAAFGIAPRPTALVAYGRQLIGYESGESGSGVGLIELRDSGYFGYRAGGERFVIDAGPMGPRYQPGHGHCDLFSFELVLEGRRVIVDSGVFGYDNDEMRRYARSTAAHNTVAIDGAEQSDIWSAFRVGRRAHPFGVGLKAALSDGIEFRASHDGYRHLQGRPVHERQVQCQVGREWRIADRILGSGRHRIASHLHFHPALSLRQEAGRWLVADTQGRPVVRVTPTGGEARLLASAYCPEFGIKLENAALCIETEAELPATLGYAIERA